MGIHQCGTGRVSGALDDVVAFFYRIESIITEEYHKDDRGMSVLFDLFHSSYRHTNIENTGISKLNS